MQVFIPLICIRTRKRFFLRTEVLAAEEASNPDSSPVTLAAVSCPYCAPKDQEQHAKLAEWCEQRRLM